MPHTTPHQPPPPHDNHDTRLQTLGSPDPPASPTHEWEQAPTPKPYLDQLTQKPADHDGPVDRGDPAAHDDLVGHHHPVAHDDLADCDDLADRDDLAGRVDLADFADFDYLAGPP